jgi:large subunit ribosomal protein L21
VLFKGLKLLKINEKSTERSRSEDNLTIGTEHEDRKMFAVIKTGGKQYRVAPEEVIRIDRVTVEPGQVIEFVEVLLVGGDTPVVGAPMVSGATVAGEVLQHTRGEKVIAFKKRRRKNSRRKRGYRHDFSVIRITEILTDGAKPSKASLARPQREPKKAEPSTEAAEGKTKTQTEEKTAAKKTSKTTAKTKN